MRKYKKDNMSRKRLYDEYSKLLDEIKAAADHQNSLPYFNSSSKLYGLDGNIAKKLVDARVAVVEMLKALKGTEDSVQNEVHSYPNRVISDVKEYILNNLYNTDDEANLPKDRREDYERTVRGLQHRDNYDILDMYLGWNGIFGYTDDIYVHYFKGDLGDYLDEEGIYGYTDDINSIMEA